jgi:uncharacterized protein YndB with AHSA1/START domain
MTRLLGYLATAAAAFGAAPLAAEVTDEKPSGFVSRHEVIVTASPKEVWLALISPARWWRSDHTWSGASANLTLTPQAGGCFCETIPEVDTPGKFTLEGSVEHMRVIQAYPERALRMQGALGPLQSEPVNGILTIAISEAKGGTRIVWEYNVGGSMRYEVPVIAKAVDGVMGSQIAALAKLLGPVTVAEPAASPPPPQPASSGPTVAGEVKVPAPPAGKVPLPAIAPGTAPSPKVAPKPAAQPAAKPAPGPAPKPSSVEDAFSDLNDRPKP